MNLKLIISKKVNLIKETFSIFLWFLLISNFILINSLILSQIASLDVLTFYFRLTCYVTSVVYLFKINNKYKNKQKVFLKPTFLNYSIFVFIFIVFNSIFPIKQINELFYFKNFANIWIFILVFCIFIGFSLDLSVNTYINRVKTNNYFSLFIGLKNFIIFLIYFLIEFYNLKIKIKLIFRKKLNFVITNFNKTKIIKYIKLYDTDLVY